MDMPHKHPEKEYGEDKYKFGGYVYFIMAENGRMKIGKTAGDPRKRFSTIQTSSPLRLSLMGYVAYREGNDLEGKLHSMFSEYRITGEWFEIPEDKFTNVQKMIDTVMGKHE